MKYAKYLFLAAILSSPTFATSQKLGFKKLKNAAKSLFKEEAKPTPQSQDPSSTEGEDGSVKGKKLAPVNVGDHLANASSALSSQQWTNARYEIKDALSGVEIEIGYKLIDAMPTSVSGLSYNPDDDAIVSSGIGFLGLVISRYYGEDSKRFTSTIGNNSAMGAGYGSLANASYSSNDGEHKNVTVQGYRGSLSFDGYNTYNLGVSFGQSSVFVLECEECSGEEEIMAAAKEFDISKFESMLRDQENDSQNGDAEAYLSEATSKYNSKNLEGARSEMQRALVEIDVVIGKMILDMLPNQIAGLSANTTTDEHLASAAGFGGVFVKRLYESADKTKSLEISLVDDSPLMGALSGFMSSPLIATMSGKKSITIDGYKGMLEEMEDSDPHEFNINIPSSQSLLTITSKNLSETELTSASNLVPVGKIFQLIK